MDKEQIDNLLTKFDLMNKLDVTLGNLSFGQQKKIALLRIFINDADLILLDEPFVGLGY
jgi:heme exporter protein A